MGKRVIVWNHQVMKNIFQIVLVMCIVVLAKSAFAQNKLFTRQDSLRGSITKERNWWDLSFYHLDVTVCPSDSSLNGQNTIRYKVLMPYQLMQIDLQEPMQIVKVMQDGKFLDFNRDGKAWFITLLKEQTTGDFNEIVISFKGKPTVSTRPPWSGGLSWKKDVKGTGPIG